MVIRPMTAAYTLGESGRPAKSAGGKSGPAALFADVKDLVSLGNANATAGLYSGNPVFKIMGAVELMSDESDVLDQQSGFGDTSFVL